MQQNTSTSNTSSNDSMGQVEMQQAAQDCMTCHDVCMQTVQQCQQAGGKHGETTHIQMMQECAELCQANALFLQHGSPVANIVCGVTAQVAERCANECEQMGDSDCANACRNASWSTGQIAKMVM